MPNLDNYANQFDLENLIKSFVAVEFEKIG